MADQAPVFTASRIAELLDQDRKTIRQQLAGISPTRRILVKGQEAQAWSIADLGPVVRGRLETLAHNQGFADVDRYLEKGRTRWQPRIPVGMISSLFAQSAQERCAVLAPVTRACRNEPISEIVAKAQAAWRTKTGYVPRSDRTIRRWIKNAMTRDRGFEEWERWPLYLDGDYWVPPAAAPADAAAVFNAVRLEQAILAIKDPGRPTRKEVEGIWRGAMFDADAIVKEGRTETFAQEIVLAVLRRAGLPLSKNFGEALRVQYCRKRARWHKGGGVPSAIADQRPTANKGRGWQPPAGDLEQLRSYYKNAHSLDVAWQMARQNKVLTPETMSRFKADEQVPKPFREALKTDLVLIDDRRIGPRDAKLNGGWIERDHSGYEPGDWWQGDDLTPPIYFWDESQAPYFFTRGQLLVMIDCRTTFILGWVLLSARSYNARAIRSLITRCHDEHGLPRKGFYFERGVWACARILKGKLGQTMVGFDETETGLREFGLHFEHANTPRAKVIERVFGLLQNRMEHLPGYCGRDERRDCPERTKRQIQDVVSGRVHPSEHFMHKEEWAAEIERIVVDHNSKLQGHRAKLIPGESPATAYGERCTDDIVWLPIEARYLLANHRLPRTVQRNGLRLPPGLGGGLYRGEATGSIIGREVLAWVDPDNLETITITNLDRENPRLVARADPLPAFCDNPADIQAAMNQLAAHNRYGANLYRIVSSGPKPPGFRRVVVDRQTTAVGAEMQRQAQEMKDRTETVNRLQRMARTEAAKLGVAIPAGRDPTEIEDQADALRKLRQAMNGEGADE